MKSAFLGFGITICSILSLVIVMTLCGTNMRQNELNRSVDLAIMDTVRNQGNSNTYGVNSNDEYKADFIEALLVQINSDCSVEVKGLDVDYEKGILSVEVVAHYKHPNGNSGSVSVKRKVILEQCSMPLS